MKYENLRGKIWFNNKFVESKKAKLHVLSHSLHFASAVFEGIRIYNFKPFKLKEHIERFYNSSLLLDYKIHYPKKKLINTCLSLTKKLKLKNGYLRPIAWRGSESMAPGIRNATINVAIAGWKWPVYYSKIAKEKGISLNISKWKRPSNESAPTQSKCSGLYMICTMAKHDAERKGYDDSLMLDYRNFIAETTSSNIFFIKGKKVFTPTADVFLNGVTRKVVIDICKKNKIKIVEKFIDFKDLNKFDSCFITGTAAEITPVKRILKKKFKTDNSILKFISKRFTELTK